MSGRKPAYGPKGQLWDRPGRLIGILWQLARAGDVGLTVKQLQPVFGVSDRQIGRDLATLQRARIPLVCYTPPRCRGRGYSGGRWRLQNNRDRIIADQLAELTGIAPSSSRPHSLRRLSA